MSSTLMQAHRNVTRRLAKNLEWRRVYLWLIQHGYFPESYVLPPCFKVSRHPDRPRLFVRPTSNRFQLTPKDTYKVHFPKTDLTDRTFGIMDPDLHNDIAYHISRNWKTVVDRMLPNDSRVACYSFPIPVDAKHPGRMGQLRSGRMIYEFIWMTEEDLAARGKRPLAEPVGSASLTMSN